MPPVHRDPRVGHDYDYSFVESVPLPIASQKGLKIQARSEVVYNPAFPSRDEVRKENYSRRLSQVMQQGFSSVNFKPYKGIGDPFYLDQKKLILHALGQWEEGQELISSSRPKSDDEQQKLLDQQKNMQPKGTTKFRLRRTRKDLHTLNKGVLHAREIIRNVSLGHGLFHLLKKEKMVKMSTQQREMRQKREKQLREWQPPKSASSSDSDTDNETTAGVDLTSGGRSIAPSSACSRSARSHSSQSRKHTPTVRPFTPHSTISVEPQQDALDTQSLFRQLCALYWLLEAMAMEVGNMPPITTSWNLKHFTTIKGTDVRDREKLDNKWADFVRVKAYREANWMASREHNLKRSSSFFRGSTATLLSTPSSSQSQLFHVTSSAQTLYQVSTPIPEHSEVHSVSETIPAASEVDASDARFISGTDKNNQDLIQLPDQQDDDTPVHRRISITLPVQQKRGSRLTPECTRTYRKPLDIRKATETLRGWSDEDSWIERRMEDGDRKGSRSSLRAERNVRPKSSPAVIKFQMECTSNDAHDMPMRMRQEFVEISEEHAIMMHDTLESIERERLRKLQNKFIHMPTRYSNFYNAIKVMRTKSAEDDLKKMKNRRRSSIHKQWFVDLENNIGVESQKDWYVRTILDKLKEKYGMIQSGNQTAFKFLRVLSTLRVWEICSPDVSAAVDFCREKIIEMVIVEFDAWFASKFPEVVIQGMTPPVHGGQAGSRGGNGQGKKSATSGSCRKKSK